jgi:pimeloyl-ACP methyl ester carboxylesterase
MNETLYLDRPSGRLAYDDRGAGPLVIAMTGMGALRSQYDALAIALVGHGYRIVTVDARGFGESSAQWDDYRKQALAEDYLALVRHLDAGPAVLVASSYSAGAATAASVLEPASVSGIVLLGGVIRTVPPGFVGRLLLRIITSAPGRVLWRPYYSGLYPSVKPAGFAEHLDVLTANLKEPGRWEALGAMLRSDNSASDALVSRVAVPALVIYGDKDADFPDVSVEVAYAEEHFTGPTESLILPGLGHYPHAERPDLVTPVVLDFLERTCHERA